MGLYDGKSKANLRLPEFRFDFDWKKFKVPALGLAALLIVFFFIFSIATIVAPKALDARLDPNPLDLTLLSGEKVSYLTVSVSNVTDSTAKNVLVSVETEAADSITIFPREQNIATLGKGENRTLELFAVGPNPNGQVYTGTYIITIKTTINGQDFLKQVALQLKAA